MTPKKQVSPAIRILRGERDASARATHLEAATRKFLVTTNERKQMSTKTNFKRIALVAVAALGMGVLSSVPSQATIAPGSFTVTAPTIAGTATAGNAGSTGSDSSTGTTFSFTFLATTIQDSVVVTVAPKSKPAAATGYPQGLFSFGDTAGSTAAPVVILRNPSDTLITDGARVTGPLPSVNGTESGTSVIVGATAGANRYYGASLIFSMDSGTARTAGAYVYTVMLTPYDAAGGGLAVTANTANTKTVDVTINIAVGSATASGAYSSAIMTQGSTFAGVAGVTSSDSVVSVASTASTTARAVVRVSLRTSTNTSTADESVTVTIDKGSVGTSTGGVAVGKNVKFQYAVGTGYIDLLVFSDGTTGASTLTIASDSVSFLAKTLSFYSTTATKITAIKGVNTLGVGANTLTALGFGVVWGKAADASGATVIANATGGAGVYAYSSNTAVVSDSGTACTYSAVIGYHSCSLTGVAAGTAKITLRNSATAGAAATVSSAEVIEVTVSNSVPASLKMEFDQATYAPGQKGYIKIWAVDSTGKPVGARTLTGLITSTGITSTSSFSGNGTDSTAPALTAAATISPAVKGRVASVDGITSLEPVYLVAFNAPFAGGTIKISATGGDLLPLAGQVAVTATATVTDSGAAALAAVTALATTVASLKTLITTLTNLVLKIQKKVKA